MLTNDLVNGAHAYVSRHGCKYRMTRYSARRCVTLFGNFHDLEIHLSLFLLIIMTRNKIRGTKKKIRCV